MMPTFQWLEVSATRLCRFAALLLLVATASAAPRLAVVAGPRDGTAGDLVFETLARERGVELVERDRIGIVLRELQLSAQSPESGVRAGQLLGAQGLLFVTTEGPLRHFALVETARGEKLFDLARPTDEPAAAQFAEGLVARVRGNLERLETGKGRALRVAVMAFERADRGPRSHDLDVLTALVGATLAEHPRLIVVERDRLPALLDESFLAGAESNTLARADYVLRGHARPAGAERIELNLRLQPVAGGEPKLLTVTAATADPTDAAKRILDWVAGEMQAGPATRLNLDEEAALYYQRGLIAQAHDFQQGYRRARSHPETFPSFAMASMLCPSNRTYATAYLAELEARWDQPRPLGQRCDFFCQAIDLAERLDPEGKLSCLPAPNFLLSLPPQATAGPGTRVILFPLAMTNRIGGRDAQAMRRLVADKLRAYQHLDVLAGPEVDRLCAERGYQLGKPGHDIADALDGALQIYGTVTTPEAGRVHLELGLNWSRWKSTGAVSDGVEDDLESVAADAVQKVAYHLPPDPGRPLAWEVEQCRAAREKIERYYRRYCRVDEGFPLADRLDLWASLRPVFSREPEDALRELRGLSTQPGYTWDLAGHRFLSVGYWDTNRAAKLWWTYIEKLTRHPDVVVQFQAHRALLHRQALWTDMHIHPPGGARGEAVRRFVKWLARPDAQEAYDSGRIKMQSREFWRSFWYLDREAQDQYWDVAVRPRLQRLPLYAISELEVLPIYGLLTGRFEHNRNVAGEAERVLAHVAEARAILTERLGGRNDRVEELLGKVEDVVLDRKDATPAPAPDVSRPRIAGAELLFDYRRDLPEQRWRRWPVTGTSRLLVDGTHAWIGITAANLDHAPGLLAVVTLDANARTSRVVSLDAPGVNSGKHGTPTLLAKTKTHLCFVEFHNMLVLPLDPAGVPDAARVIHLGPEYGLPETGLRAWDKGPLNLYFISALDALDGDFYFAVSRPVGTHHYKPINYGGLVRWRPGETGVTRVVSSDTIGPGPLHDCAPYIIVDARADAAERALWMQIKHGPGAKQNYGTATPWKFTPPATWEKVATSAPPAAPTSSWRVATNAKAKTFALEFVKNGRTTTWQTFPDDAFSPGELTACDAGLFWLIHRERPLVYFIPRNKWPDVEARTAVEKPEEP